MIFDLVENNFVAVTITLFLILFILTNNNFGKRTNRLFLAAAVCVLILIVEEAWEAQLALKPVYDPMRVLLSAIGYSLRPLIAFFLLMTARRFSRASTLLLSLPSIINALVSFSALFSPLSFGYTQSNEFVRGPLGFTPFIVAGFYVILLLYYTVKKYKNIGYAEMLIVSAMVLLAFLSTVLESIFHFQFIQNPSIATSITFYYLFLHCSISNRDQLTGALTRRRFFLDAKKHAYSLTALISLDLNDLKTFNDQYGHKKGDEALTVLVHVIRKHTATKAILYRTGGDEFMILCFKQSEKDVLRMISAIRNDMEKTEYRCAIGYALNSGKTNFDHLCQAADEAMYDDKRHMKGLSAANC